MCACYSRIDRPVEVNLLLESAGEVDVVPRVVERDPVALVFMVAAEVAGPLAFAIRVVLGEERVAVESVMRMSQQREVCQTPRFGQAPASPTKVCVKLGG